MKTAVMYRRVSTKEQGDSGLGMAAQETALASFCRVEGFEVAGEFQDIASGKLTLNARVPAWLQPWSALTSSDAPSSSAN